MTWPGWMAEILDGRRERRDGWSGEIFKKVNL